MVRDKLLNDSCKMYRNIFITIISKIAKRLARKVLVITLSPRALVKLPTGGKLSRTRLKSHERIFII